MSLLDHRASARAEARDYRGLQSGQVIRRWHREKPVAKRPTGPTPSWWVGVGILLGLCAWPLIVWWMWGALKGVAQ